MDKKSVHDRARELVKQLKSEFDRYTDIVGMHGFKLYKPQQNDMIVDTFLKSGTTLTQQILCQLLCASGKVANDPTGELFEDISQVVPFIEPAHKTKVEVSRNPYTPRCFKSHAKADMFDGKQRYIYCFRDAWRVGVSLFDFIFDWLVPAATKHPDSVRHEAYRMWVREFYLKSRMWYKHIRSWRDAVQASGYNTLFIDYDDMCEDLEQTVRRIARFIGVNVTDDVVKLVSIKCSRENMVGDRRFNDTLISRVMGWNIELGNRVRPANAKGVNSLELGDELMQTFRLLYKSELGGDNYAELKRALYELNQK